MNNIESQYLESTNSFEQDLFTPFVLSGLVASKDGTIANQLDITAGVAFLLQSSDNTLRRRAPTSTTKTTSTPSTTYYLYLQPDGTWYWNTANTPAAHSLAIAQVTTDGSGNISAVTDERTLNTSLLSGMAGTLSVPYLYSPKVSGELEIDRTLSGLNLGFLMMKATDGKEFEFVVNSGGSLSLIDTTDSKTLWTASSSLFAIYTALNSDNGVFSTDGSGNVTAVSYNGPVKIDVESSQTVIRSQPTGNPVIIQANGNNFTFSASGVFNSGGTIQQNGTDVALTGSHSSGQIALSYGSGVPGSLSTNEIYFQTS